LFDLEGRVVGVNTAIFSPNGGNIGIGFAIPAAQVTSVVDELRDKGRVERGWLGVNVQDLTEELAAGLGIDEAHGALVAGVVEDSPAAAAGVMAGDVIVGLNGEPLADVRELVRNVGASDPGDTIELDVWRMGDTEQLSARLGEAEEAESAPVLTSAPDSEPWSLGLRVDDLDNAMRRRLRLADDVSGVLVRGVSRGSAAAERGLRGGDVIVGVGQQPVASVEEFEAALASVMDSGRDAVVLQVLRAGVRSFVAVPLG
jgi:serine protease Do